MKAGRLCARIFGEVDMAAFPVVAADDNTFELNGMSDVGKPERDGANLFQQLIGVFPLTAANSYNTAQLTPLLNVS